MQEQIKLARISALKNRNAKGVGVLDEELRSGRGTDFPHDAEFYVRIVNRRACVSRGMSRQSHGVI